MKADLKKFNEDQLGGLSLKESKRLEELEAVQRTLLLCRRQSTLLQSEQEKSHCFMSLNHAEESFLKQKSRDSWLNLGDQNTSFLIGLSELDQRRI